MEEAEAAAHRALELIPMGPFGHSFLGNVLLLRGQPDVALTEFSKEAVERRLLRVTNDVSMSGDLNR